MRHIFILLAVIISSLSSITAFASLEKAGNNTDLISDDLLVEGELSIFSANGLGLLRPDGILANKINLSTNANGELRWNGNTIVNANGELNATNANLDSIKLSGNQNLLCDQNNKGTVRYNVEVNEIEFCDGIDFVGQDGFTNDSFRRVFVTRAKRTANFGGLKGADKICSDSAANANLSGNWIALLGTSNVRPKDRVPNNTNLKRLDGVIVNKDGLWDGAIDNPINITEDGVLLSTVDSNPTVWSGSNFSNPDGTTGINQANGNHFTCLDWTSTSHNGTATKGNSGQTNLFWFAGFGVSCVHSASGQNVADGHFYCVETRDIF